MCWYVNYSHIWVPTELALPHQLLLKKIHMQVIFFCIIVSRLINQTIPSLDLPIINLTVKEVFSTNLIMNEDGLWTLLTSNSPKTDSSGIKLYWNLALFRRVIYTIIMGCGNHKLLPTILYNLLLQHCCNWSNSKPLLTGKNITSNSPVAYSVKTIAGVSLNKHLGLTSNF